MTIEKVNLKKSWPTQLFTTPLRRDHEENSILIEDWIDEDFIHKELKIHKRRFKAADLDKNGFLDQTEFPAFIHPEEFPKIMSKTLAQETLENIDTNKDGLIDEKEWIFEIYEKDNQAKERKEKLVKESEVEEPAWVTNEIDHFYTHRDSDGDGKMDVHDVERWLNPEGFCAIKSDIEHLMSECDINKDDKLSLQEIMNKYHVFYTSKSTMYGQAIQAKVRDEL